MSIQAQAKPAIQAQAAAKVLRAGKIIDTRLIAAVPRKTGALARSRKSRLVPGVFVIAYSIEYPSKIANYTNEGTKAHVIRARRAKVLRFKWHGRVVFYRQVHWRPGAGVARNKRWFSKNTTLTAWRSALR